MGLFKRHIYSMNVLEKRLRDQDKALAKQEAEAKVLMRELEQFEEKILQRYGEKEGEKIIKESFKAHFDKLNSLIGTFRFIEAEEKLRFLEATLRL
ncbi:hypothetical protein JW711_03540 [Candidatus Woesearchaeota archaeon]|nr:hypothetical protein [Candidatus Woesearchaeota archaeon]